MFGRVTDSILTLNYTIVKRYFKLDTREYTTETNCRQQWWFVTEQRVVMRPKRTDSDRFVYTKVTPRVGSKRDL